MTTHSERYKKLMTMGIHATCASCGYVETHICPKATGWSPNMWEMNCSACHLFNSEAFDGYRPEHAIVTKELGKHFDQFLAGENLDHLDAEIGALAVRFDPLMENTKCECGGMFTIAAKPRCKQCAEVIFDSYFHYA